jgi:hypothetical protein
MPDKPKPETTPDDPAESDRFIDMALELEADEAPEAFDRAFKKIVTPSGSRLHQSETPTSS